MKKHISSFASIISWCLMPNHFHLVVFVLHDEVEIEMNNLIEQNNKTIKTQTFNQSLGVLLSSYTRAIQKQERITGSLFQKRTKAKLIFDEIKIEPSYWNTAFGTQINISEGKNYLQTCIEYVHQNPVYSVIVKNPEDWEFSSFRDFVGLRDGKLLDYDILAKEKLIDSVIRHPNQSRETTNTCIIGIGSNLDADANIPKMLKILAEKTEVVKVSAMIKTKPIGILDQPDYTNGAVKITTDLNQEDLTVLLKSIEDQMGRDRTAPKFGPRTIDLDIVVWNGEIVDKDYYTRDFLKKSVDEIT
ncbi:MAG: 2-amino-4-hydroxy-6-hydroxymethyldihydropteridine diphosphokinase [Bacteroidales bacterium]|nr:2-amino-4-hydroxy-6-hydroxymethyldihydropteridine diphosphokinase [Bacteroidales bacterium]